MLDATTKKPILAICPTRERPEKCRLMLESFNANRSSYIDLVFCIDMDDPTLGDYIKLFESKVPFYMLERMTITKIFNKVAFKLSPGYQIYHMTNDDFIYHSLYFDKVVMETFKEHGTGIYYGDDGFWDGDIATAPFITADLIHAVGWLQMPKLVHLCNDTIWTTIGRHLDILHYLPIIKIEHFHPETKGIEADTTTKRVNAPDVYNRDYATFFKWKAQSMAKDLEKCRAVLRTEKK